MSYGQYNQNPYQEGPPQGAGYAAGYTQSSDPYNPGNPYAQDSDYELQSLPQQSTAPSSAAVLSQNDFLDRVQRLRNDIKGLTSDIDYVGQLHQRTLNSTDGSASEELEQFVTKTQIRNTAIKDGIKGLERDLAKTTDTTRNTKRTQLESLKTFFKSELDKYQSIERDYQQRYRDQIARQYRIVNPDASEEEVQEAANTDWGDEGVFQTALRTNRTGHANNILGNVRARHNELVRIEQTLSELATLFQELATVVEQQEDVVVAAENNAVETTVKLEEGTQHIDKGIVHARTRRKLMWWCILIVVLIIVAIGLGVGLGIHFASSK